MNDNHASDCAVHNEPAYPAGPCDCHLAIASRLDELMTHAYQGSSEAAQEIANELIEIYKAMQPAMTPCAGRNCGSINPNLHSAECFEDYEKATGMVMQEPVANIRTWHKDGELHAELWNWDRGIESLPDGEHNLYTASPKQWVGLTDEDKKQIANCDFMYGVEWAEAKLKEKNT